MTLQTFAMVGIREDLSDTIYRVDPQITPFTSNIKKGKTGSRTPEWQKDTLAAANGDNKAIEGADIVGGNGAQPERLKDVVQLMTKDYKVSSTARAVNTAGRKDELAYQTMRGGLELKRDKEKRFTGNYASVLGAAGTAGESAGIESWLETNTNRGGGGSDGGFNSGTGLVVAATDGTPRTFTESLLRDTLAQVAVSTDYEVDMIMLGVKNKQVMSTFPGIALNRIDNNKGTKAVSIIGAADLYQSDFGTHSIVLNKFQRDRSALLINTSKWELTYLQALKTERLAKLGLSERNLLSCEVTLKSFDEKANGVVADLVV